MSQRLVALCVLALTAGTIAWQPHQRSKPAVPSVRQLAAGLAVASSVVFNGPELTLARSGNQASNLFSEAEEAMRETVNSYKQAKQDWSSAKKLVITTRSDISSAKVAMQKISLDAQGLEGKLSSVLADAALSDTKIAAEIVSLQQSTALKYQEAEAAALPESRKRPAYTASLFSRAANEAAVLAKSEALLLSFKESEAALAEGQRRIAAATSEVNGLIATIESVEQALQAGNAQLEEGVAPALEDLSLLDPNTASTSATGARLFASGAQVVEQETSKASSAVRSLAGVCKALSAFDADTARISDRLDDGVLKQAAWEKETKLSAKVAGAALKSTAAQIKTASSQAGAVASRACEAVDRFEEKIQKDKKDRRTTTVPALRSVQGRLEQAERRARDTEQLIRAAAQKGQEEASKFKRYIPATPAVPP